MPRALRSTQSFALYYGMGEEERLSQYDLIIVDPGGHTPSGVRRLKSRGGLALSYVSVLEVPRRSGVAPPSNVLIADGQPVCNDEFHNWVLDPRAPQTRRRLSDLVKRALVHYDGVFLDCLDDVNLPQVPPVLRAELLPAAAHLVEHAASYNGVLVQNWGLHNLLPMTAPFVDGVCYENFPFNQVGAVPTLHSGIRSLQSLQLNLGLRVLALNQGINDPQASARARDAAQRCNFLWYGAPRYSELPEESMG